MAQKVLFPGTYMRITQDEYGSTSHRGSLARDDGGQSTAFDSPVLAPFDGYFARVRKDSSHETYFVSDGPVECANGYVGLITFLFMHDNINRFAEGTHVKQGTIIGYEGGFGYGVANKFAHHTHREWSKGKNTTQFKNGSGTYVIANQMHEYDVCFVRPDTMISTNGSTSFKAAKNFGGVVKDNKGHVFKISEGDEKVSAISSESIYIQIYSVSGAAISSGDVVALQNLCKPLGITLHSDNGTLVTDQKVSAGDQIAIIGKAHDLNLECREYTDKADPLSKDPITMKIGPASAGDRAAIKKEAEALGLGYKEETEYCIVGPASSGDQIIILTKAEALGLGYSIYVPDNVPDDGCDCAKEIETLNAEIEKLNGQIVTLTNERDHAIVEKKEAEREADEYLDMIDNAKKALGV